MFTLGIGRTIKKIRKERKMTLHDLAEKVGLSASYLSLLERGMNDPSISSVHTICQALGITLNDLLNQAESCNQLIIRPENRRLIAVEEGITMKSLTNDTSEFSILSIVVEDEMWHESSPHISDEYGLVAVGEMQVRIENEIFEVSAGDSIFIPANTRHAYKLKNGPFCETFWINSARDHTEKPSF